MIKVFNSHLLLPQEWKSIKGTELLTQMVRNQFVIRGMVRDYLNCKTDSPEDLISDYIDNNSSGLCYIDNITDNGSVIGWICYFEHAEDRDNIMAWVKLKYEGTGEPDDDE